MEKVRPWCGQPSDRGRLNNRTELIGIAKGQTIWLQAVKNVGDWGSTPRSCHAAFGVLPTMDQLVLLQKLSPLAGMLILGLGFNAKFLGLGILWPWPWVFGLGHKCSGLSINNKANRHIILIMQYWIIANVHWIQTSELPSTCHKRPGLLTYLL